MKHSLRMQDLNPKSTTWYGIGNPLPVSSVPIIGWIGTEEYSELPFAEIEVQHIGTMFGQQGHVLIGEQATTEAVESSLSTAVIVHLACHAEFSLSYPLFSGFILSGGKRINLAQIVRSRHLPIRMALLSACQTAIIDFELPEESIGLPSGFLQAGVPQVIATLWSVNDLSTALLMIRFYQELMRSTAEQIHPAEALRRAQLWLRSLSAIELYELAQELATDGLSDRTRMALSTAQQMCAQWVVRDPLGKPFSHPYYWAGFAFYGI